MSETVHDPQQVLDLWFPENGFWGSQDAFMAWLKERMYGGMDATICRDFADMTCAAARSELDHWADTAEGRIALLIVLDQFPRSLWRDTPAAYAQDIKANRLVLAGIANGHFAAISPWKKIFYIIALGHCEGPNHLDRIALLDELAETVIAENPPQLAFTADMIRGQNQRVRAVIERFGRHPHRNAHFGRLSSADEEAYLATGDFPHLSRPDMAGQ